MTLKRKVLTGFGLAAWTSGAVAVIKLEAEIPVDKRDLVNDTRVKRAGLVVLNPVFWLSALALCIADIWLDVFEDFFDDLGDFWRQPK